MTKGVGRLWRKEVEGQLGPVPDKVWAFCVEQEFLDDAAREASEHDEQDALEELIERVKGELLSFGAYSEPVGPKLPRAQSQPRSEPAEESKGALNVRTEALGRIVSALVDRHPEVEAFRARHLDGKKLTPAEVAPWVMARAGEVPPAVRVALTVADGDGWQARLVEAAKALADSATDAPTPHATSSPLLAYRSAAGDVCHAPLGLTGPLPHLKRLAGQFGWFFAEAGAVSLILTGEPRHLRSTIRVETCDYGQKIGLDVWPWETGDEVREKYLRARVVSGRPLGGKPQRELREKAVRLAVFATENAAPWGRRLVLWNRQFPDDKYPNRSTFEREARAAYQRLTGWEWEGE